MSEIAEVAGLETYCIAGGVVLSTLKLRVDEGGSVAIDADSTSAQCVAASD